MGLWWGSRKIERVYIDVVCTTCQRVLWSKSRAFLEKRREGPKGLKK
jgi:hypothetical protein